MTIDFYAVINNMNVPQLCSWVNRWNETDFTMILKNRGELSVKKDLSKHWYNQVLMLAIVWPSVVEHQAIRLKATPVFSIALPWNPNESS